MRICTMDRWLHICPDKLYNYPVHLKRRKQCCNTLLPSVCNLLLHAMRKTLPVSGRILDLKLIVKHLIFRIRQLIL